MLRYAIDLFKNIPNDPNATSNEKQTYWTCYIISFILIGFIIIGLVIGLVFAVGLFFSLILNDHVFSKSFKTLYCTPSDLGTCFLCGVIESAIIIVCTIIGYALYKCIMCTKSFYARVKNPVVVRA
jgi:ABC-type sugar transport system permease subunit